MSDSAPAGPAVTYEPAYFDPLFAIEDRHFWFRARNALIETVIRQETRSLAPGYRVLEVGCGTGAVLRALDRACPGAVVIGMDLFAEGLRYARRRTTAPLVRGDVRRVPFGASFDAIGLFDVLEHLPDDEGVLREVRAALAPGGVLLLTVPARRALWSYFDEAAHHCRRYERVGLAATLRRAGYEVEYSTHAMAALFPLVWLGRRLARGLGRRPGRRAATADQLTRQELRLVPGVNQVLTWLLKLETVVVGRRARLPIGTSLLVVARPLPDAGEPE